MTLPDALAVIAVHDHPHYKTERTQYLLQEARQIVVKHVQDFERERLRLESLADGARS